LAQRLGKSKAEQLVAIFVQNKLDVIIKCINSRIAHTKKLQYMLNS